MVLSQADLMPPRLLEMFLGGDLLQAVGCVAGKNAATRPRGHAVLPIASAAIKASLGSILVSNAYIRVVLMNLLPHLDEDESPSTKIIINLH